MNAGQEADVVFMLGDRCVRADPDALAFEWVEEVAPMKAVAADAQDVDSSTAIASDSEASLASSSQAASVHVTAAFNAGDSVVPQGLRNAPELNGMEGKVLRFVHPAGQCEIKLRGQAGTKALKSENLMLSASASTPSL